MSERNSVGWREAEGDAEILVLFLQLRDTFFELL